MEDGWRVETRVRTSGKQAGCSYKLYKSPSGVSYWSLVSAQEAGFTGYSDGRPLDARAKRKNKKKA